ncbi:XRE family transcriptional regulator [Sulfurimonas sp.]
MVGERIAKARKNAGYSDQKAFAPVIKVGARTLADYETNNSEPKASTLKLIAESCEVTTDWILFGVESTLPTIPCKELSEDIVSINYYPDIYAAAGYGSINEYGLNPEAMTFDRKFLQELLNVRNFNNLDIIRVMGDSMEPFIHNGEFVILERSNEAFNGETVIANIHGQVYIKRFHADPFKKWIKLVSDNEVYGDINLDTPEHIEALSIIGIVRAKIKPF